MKVGDGEVSGVFCAKCLKRLKKELSETKNGTNK
jgi:hypothetical protein